MKNSYIYKPFVFLLIVFALDKIFLLEYFQKEFLQTGNVVHYRHREMLLKRLQERKNDKKLIVAFGDSRAYAFSDLALKPEQKKKYEIYNFSAPQAVPAYSFYMFRKMIKSGVVPDQIYFVISPEGFDDSKRLFHSPFLRLGADNEFIDSYRQYIPDEDYHRFLLDRLIAVRSVEFNLKLFIDRLAKGEMDQYDPDYSQLMMILNIYKGETLAYNTYVNDVPALERNSLQLKSIYLSGFNVHDTQFYFIEEMFRLAQENNVKIYAIWPKVYKDYREEIYKLGLREKWWNRIVDLTIKYGMKTVDFNKGFACDLFYDASHQSIQCVKEQVDYLMKQ